MSEDLTRALVASWTNFLDANPDDLSSPDDLPDHALMTGDQFVQYATAAFVASSHAPTVEAEPVAAQWRKVDRVMKHEEVWSYVDYATGLLIASHPEKYEVRYLVPAATISALVAERDEARRELADLRASWGAAIQEMSEKFRAVNVARVAEITNQDAVRWCQENAARAITAERERDEARALVAKCCNHLPSGAYCSPDASIEFMRKVPDEVLLVTSRLVDALATANARIEGLEKALEPVFEQAAHVSLGLATPLDVKDATRELVRLIADVPGSLLTTDAGRAALGRPEWPLS